MKLKFFHFGHKNWFSGRKMSYPFENNLAREISRKKYEQGLAMGCQIGSVVAGFIVEGEVRVCWTFPEPTQVGMWRLRSHNLVGSETSRTFATVEKAVDELISVAVPPTVVSEQQAYDAGNFTDN